MINFEVYKENAEERLSYTSSDTPSTFIRVFEDIVKLCEYGQKLEAENQALQKQVQELEKALIKLVKLEVRLPECIVCWERDRCTDHSHGDNCLAVGYIVDTAKEAAKE